MSAKVRVRERTGHGAAAEPPASTHPRFPAVDRAKATSRKGTSASRSPSGRKAKDDRQRPRPHEHSLGAAALVAAGAAAAAALTHEGPTVKGQPVAPSPTAKPAQSAAGSRAAFGAPAAKAPAANPAVDKPIRESLGAELLFNRELSWLDFNARVLAQAENPATPVLERVKFLSIFSTNLDEFFMVRVAGLKEQARTKGAGPDPGAAEAGGLAAHSGSVADVEGLIDAIARRVRELVGHQGHAWQKELRPALAEAGIEVVLRGDLSEGEVRELRKYFQRQVYPVLTPLGIDPAHPFPHLPNKSLSLIVVLRGLAPRMGRGGARSAPNAAHAAGGGEKPLYAFVEVPQILPRFVPLGKASRGRARFVLLRDVIGMFLPDLFAGAQVVDSYVIRITRDSDLDVDDDEAEDLLRAVEAELRERNWGNVVRLEVSNRAPDEVVRFLRESLRIEKRDVYPIEGPLNFGDFFSLSRLAGFDALRYPPFTPHLRPAWREALSSDSGAPGPGVFPMIRAADRLVHHPFESFSTVMDFIEAAACDPDVLAIKMTLYRTSSDSPIMRSLIRAAQNGKQVVALVELKARFDEANNIHTARQLERGGAHVVYGIVGLKTHCKACLVVRREGKELRRYAHLATGNYNPATANLYTDLGLFTADPEVTEDVANLFNMMTGFAHHVDYNAIVPSPEQMPARLVGLVQEEIRHARRGAGGRIVCKMNSLVDPTLTGALYEASQAGVKIDLIVRGICCLRPGVPGVSENIRVTSLVGRFLEHTRAFLFGNGGEPLVYLSSADWMQRNFYSRVEVMFPVRDPALRRRIAEEILEGVLADTANAWELRADGTWRKKSPAAGKAAFDSQAHFVALEGRTGVTG